MNTLIVNLQQTMTSLEIAELTGKQHKNVMQAIRNMEPAWEKVNGLKFQLVEYKDAKGELRPITRCQARCDTMFISRKSILTKMTMTTLTTARQIICLNLLYLRKLSCPQSRWL